MVKKNEEYIDEVVDYGSNGEGIIKRDNLVIFIPFCIVGEIVRHKILKIDGNIAFSKLIEVLTASKERCSPVCTVFTKCGGCDLQHLKYNSGLEIKRENVKRCFSKIAFTNVNVEKCVPSDKTYAYRNKLQLPVQFIDGKVAIGFYARNTHRVIPITDCPINPPWASTIISVFTEYVNKCGVNRFEVKENSGLLREITVKEFGGALIITAVCRKNYLPSEGLIISLLKKNFNAFSLYVNVNDSEGNAIYGENFYKVYGEDKYFSEFNGIKVESGVSSFSQVNDGVCKKLYDTVTEYATQNSPEVILDVYSGAGLLTAILAKKAQKVYGIEVVSEAVQKADIVALNNGLADKMINICGKAEEVLPKLIENENLKDVTVVLDPPRKGCDIAVIDAVKKSRAKKIVYVSCMPSTLSRDVGLFIGTLVKDGNVIKKAEKVSGCYEIEKIIPFDMFPQTKHVETVCVLNRVD